MHRSPFVGMAVAVLVGAGCGDGGAPRPEPGEAVVVRGGRRAELDEGRFLPLTTSGARILDAEGREVILRGLQHHALQDVDYGGREVEPGDYARIASWGFSTLRTAISWSRVEPSPGAYDSAYLAQIGDVLDRAHAAGLTVILEWHQDLWGRCSQKPDTPLAANANGAPDWTCPTDFDPSVPLGYWALFDRLWANDEGVRDALLGAWGAVIDAVGAHPAVAGYDMFNEPQGNGGTPVLERDKVFPAFRAIVPALRARGARGLLFLDAPILRNETFEMYTEPLDDLGPGVVYAPHLYSGWLQLYVVHQRVGREAKERDFTTAVQQAAALRIPVWNGEWGVNLFLEGALADLQVHVTLEDRYRIGSSYWAFQRAVPGQGDDSISGGQSLLDEDRTVRTEVLDRLSRPYPIQTPGRLVDLSFDFSTRTLQVVVEADASIQAPLVLYAPARHLGDVACLEVQGPGSFAFDTRPERERVLIRFDAGGRYTLRLFPCG